MAVDLQTIKNNWNSKSSFDIGKNYYGSSRLGFVGDVANIGNKTFKTPEELHNAINGGGGSSWAGSGWGGTGTNMSGNYQDMFDSQRNQEQEFLKRYYDKVNSMENYEDAAKRLEGELGLKEYRQNTLGLTNTAIDQERQLSDLRDQVHAENRGFDVNEAQLNRIHENRQIPLVNNYNQTQSAVAKAQNAQNVMENQLLNYMNYVVAQQGKELAPYQAEQAMLGERMAREASGFTQAKQQELQMLLHKEQLNQQLSMAEMEHKYTLEKMAQQYQNDISKMAQQFQYDQSLSTQGYNQQVGMQHLQHKLAKQMLDYQDPTLELERKVIASGKHPLQTGSAASNSSSTSFTTPSGAVVKITPTGEYAGSANLR